MAAEVASMFVSILPTFKGGSAAISKELGGHMDTAGADGGKRYGTSMSTGIAGMAKGIFAPLAAAAAGVGVFSFLKGAIGGASDLNETVSKSNIIFGENAGAVSDWAKNAATKVGLSKAAALDSAAGFGNMFTQLGFAGDAAANMSTGVVQMAADLGSFNNLPTADVADMMSGAFRGEYDSLQRLVPNINAARVEQEALTATGKTSVDQLTAQDKATAVLAIVQKDGAKASGDFARTQDGAANSSKIAAAQAEDLKAKVGQGLLPAWTALLGFMNTTVIPGLSAVAGWFTTNASAIGVVAGVIAAIFLPLFIKLGIEATISAAKQVAGWVASSAGAIAATVVSIAQFVIQGAKWVWMAGVAMVNAAIIATAWLISMGPIAIVIAAVIGLGILIALNMDRIKGWISSAWNWIKTTTTSVWYGIASFFSGLWSSISSTMTTAWDGMLDFFTGIPGKIKGMFSGAVTWLKDIGKNIIQGLLDGAGGLLSKLGSFFLDKVPAFIREPFKAALGINSPSRVFAGYGVNLGEGLIQGVDSMESQINASMSAMVALPSLPNLNANVSSIGAQNTSSGSSGAGITQNIYPTPGLSEQQIGDAAARQLAWKMKEMTP